MVHLTTTTLPITLFTLLFLFLFLLASPASAAMNTTNGTYTKPPITPTSTLTSTSGTKPTQTGITAGAPLSYSGGGEYVVGLVAIVAAGVLGLGLGF